MKQQKIENKKIYSHKILIIINIFVVFLLLLSYSSLIINPEKFKYLSIFGLFYPFSLALNILMIIVWYVFDKKMILISLFTILIGWKMFTTTFQFNLFPEKDKINSFSVLSYNVRMFDKYNWIKEDSTTFNILKFIEQQSADIVCIQDFYSNDKDEIVIEKKMKNFAKSKYSHIIFASKGSTVYNYGFATFSGFPIINKGSIKYGNNNEEISIFSDIVIEKDTIRFYNCHFESVHFEYEDYYFIDSLVVNNNNANKLQRFKKILSKLVSAYEIRSNQAELIIEHIASSPYPAVVCGDFNDTPVSYAYHQISKNMEDAFVESGFGLGSTYIYSFLRLRIDYILHDEKLESANFKTYKIRLSDHYPVSCDFTLSN
jgi:endonuclease/exonuclease/phosphatase family metal-dependent hydrolase